MDPYALPRIGRAIAPPGTNGRRGIYSVHRATDTTLTVSYAGYVDTDGSHVGTALGGPRWTPPTYFDMARDYFGEVHITDTV